jgi:hypothetical protein
MSVGSFGGARTVGSDFKATPAVIVGPNAYTEICLDGNTMYPLTNILSNMGPTNQLWMATVSIGLQGGDSEQYVFFEWRLYDSYHGETEPIASFSEGKYNWVAAGSYTVTDTETLTGAASSYANVEYFVWNVDGASQCFNLVTTTFYIAP